MAVHLHTFLSVYCNFVSASLPNCSAELLQTWWEPGRVSHHFLQVSGSEYKRPFTVVSVGEWSNFGKSVFINVIPLQGNTGLI